MAPTPSILLVAALAAPIAVRGQSDGNPHGWDRLRRCDHVGYDPPCGPCEGRGGIVWSDKATDVKIPPCWVVATKDQLDPSKLVRPHWGTVFTESASHEILIGVKEDPACFQAFPFSNSTATNCYKPQECTIHGEMVTKRAIIVEANQAGNAWGIVGNVTSIIIHQDTNMWIVNHLPLGITQTICTKPREGGDHSKPPMGPVSYNWTDNLFFVAREAIVNEYGVGNMTMDHYAFGPHHAWVDPATGTIIRMWQPWNGLQVFTPGTWKAGYVDESLFDDLSADGSTAPKHARKGGSTFRIKCADDGFPTDKPGFEPASLLEATEEPQGHQKSALSDLKRAKAKVPRPAYKGNTFGNMSVTLNRWLAKHTSQTRECEMWAIGELQQLQLHLLLLRDPELDSIYHSTSDNRRLTKDARALAAEWEELNALAARDPALYNARRDGLCHEAVMWYVHHIPEELKADLKDQVALPLLSYMRHDFETVSAAVPADASPAAVKVMRAYEEHVSCANCHTVEHPKSDVPKALMV